MSRRDLEVTVDRLVLEGLDLAAERTEPVGQWVASELQCLLAGAGEASGGVNAGEAGGAPARGAGAVVWGPAEGERALARRIAERVAPVVRGSFRQKA